MADIHHNNLYFKLSVKPRLLRSVLAESFQSNVMAIINFTEDSQKLPITCNLTLTADRPYNRGQFYSGTLWPLPYRLTLWHCTILEVSEDHFVICHDLTKSDKEGKKTHDKAVYCNPLDPVLCPGFSLGVWLSLNQNTFCGNSERVFIRQGASIGTAAHRYCE